MKLVNIVLGMAAVAVAAPIDAGTNNEKLQSRQNLGDAKWTDPTLGQPGSLDPPVLPPGLGDTPINAGPQRRDASPLGGDLSSVIAPAEGLANSVGKGGLLRRAAQGSGGGGGGLGGVTDTVTSLVGGGLLRRAAQGSSGGGGLGGVTDTVTSLVGGGLLRRAAQGSSGGGGLGGVTDTVTSLVGGGLLRRGENLESTEAKDSALTGEDATDVQRRSGPIDGDLPNGLVKLVTDTGLRKRDEDVASKEDDTII